MPTVTQEYWTYFWKLLEEYTPIIDAQAMFLEAAGGLEPWVGDDGEGYRDRMWTQHNWTPTKSANHEYTRVLKNKKTMLSAFISFIHFGYSPSTRATPNEPITLDNLTWKQPSVETLARSLFEFIDFLFFQERSSGHQGSPWISRLSPTRSSKIPKQTRISIRRKLAEEWLYTSPMSVKQGVDVIISPGGYSPLADDPSDFNMGQLLIEMSNPGGASDSYLDETEFVVLVDEEAPDIMKVFESLLQDDIWGREQTRAELLIGEQDPHTLDSLVDTCCGIPLMLYMMILFLAEIGFNQTIDALGGRDYGTPKAIVGLEHPEKLGWINLMTMFEDPHLWKSVINRQIPTLNPK